MISLRKYWEPRAKDGVVLLSKADRGKFDGPKKPSSVYGEILEEGMDAILAELPRNEGTFIDLGSGKGHLPAYVGLNYGYSRSIGIELSTVRCEIGREIIKTVPHDLSNVEYHNDDFMNFDFTRFDTLFTNNCAFTNEFGSNFIRKINREIKVGAFFICNQWVPDMSQIPRLEPYANIKVASSWMNNCPIYIFEATH
tara:strand:- start:3790 stop:4380 length:591 start_codon:yes stop_codon:yes gene_type:complete